MAQRQDTLEQDSAEGKRKAGADEHFKKIGERLIAHRETAPEEVRVVMNLKGEAAKAFIRGYATYVKGCEAAGLEYSPELYLQACAEEAQTSIFKPKFISLEDATKIWNSTSTTKGKASAKKPTPAAGVKIEA